MTDTLRPGVPLTGRPDTNGVTGPAYVSSGAVLIGTAKGARGTALPRSGSPGVESKSGLGTEACLYATGLRCWLGSARLGSAGLCAGQSTCNKHCATCFIRVCPSAHAQATSSAAGAFIAPQWELEIRTMLMQSCSSSASERDGKMTKVRKNPFQSIRDS